MIVHITAAGLQHIRDHAESAYPQECCGLLIGRTDNDGDILIAEVHPSENVTDTDPTRGFEVDPRLRFKLMRESEARADGTDIVGHYHSHPDHPATPSATDLAMVYETDFIWLICGVTENGADAVSAYLPASDKSRFDKVNLSIGAEKNGSP